MQKRIYYLDDDSFVREAVSKMLEKLGFEVRVFSQFKLFKETLEKSPPDFVLLDVMMPEKSGKEIFEFLRKEYPELSRKTFFVTGSPDTDLPREVPVIEKPVTFEKLKEIFKKY